jgi:small-conductance mechanosensitive channel
MRFEFRRLLPAALLVAWLAPAAPALADQQPSPPPAGGQTASTPDLEAEQHVPVQLSGETVLWITTGVGPYTAEFRANRISQRLYNIVHDRSITDATAAVVEVEGSLEIRIGSQLAMVVTPQDAKSLGTSRAQLAQQYAHDIETAVRADRLRYAPAVLLRSGIKGAVATVIFVALAWGIFWTTRRLQAVIARWRGTSDGLRVKQAELVPAHRVGRTITHAIRFIRFVLIVLAFDLYLTYVLGLFPWTRAVSFAMFDYLMSPVRMAGQALVGYLPKALTVLVIGTIFYGAVRLVAVFFAHVRDGGIVFEGFPAEWADPTYKIVRVLLIAFGLVIAFPYLPASDSPAFAGVSVFLGVLISLSSSSALSNIIAGLVLTYTGAFRVGDRVKLGEIFGDIVSTSMLATHIRTIKNEVVTIPNGLVLGSSVVNYSRGNEKLKLILHTSVTIGYDAPWRQVHELLTSAARATTGLLDDPPPFVWQTALNDFYVTYEINAYAPTAQGMIETYARLHANIQDAFYAAGVEIMSPHFTAIRDGNTIAIPPALRSPAYRAQGFRVEDAGAPQGR